MPLAHSLVDDDVLVGGVGLALHVPLGRANVRPVGGDVESHLLLLAHQHRLEAAHGKVGRPAHPLAGHRDAGPERPLVDVLLRARVPSLPDVELHLHLPGEVGVEGDLLDFDVVPPLQVEHAPRVDQHRLGLGVLEPRREHVVVDRPRRRRARRTGRGRFRRTARRPGRRHRRRGRLHRNGRRRGRPPRRPLRGALRDDALRQQLHRQVQLPLADVVMQPPVERARGQRASPPALALRRAVAVYYHVPVDVIPLVRVGVVAKVRPLERHVERALFPRGDEQRPRRVLVPLGYRRRLVQPVAFDGCVYPRLPRRLVPFVSLEGALLGVDDHSRLGASSDD
mmetsp:Transcript_5147/g.11148  ORF Transcript_5147/g.11148 Transcript_5147/m.11148 type:complete len:339 (-) Transcript_5147:115-1131(-)